MSDEKEPGKYKDSPNDYYIALLPLGQGKVESGPQLDKWKEDLQLFKSEDGGLEAWRERFHTKDYALMSYEVWCNCTQYDDTREDGGAQFQRMMQMMLVFGSMGRSWGALKPSVEKKIAPSKDYEKEQVKGLTIDEAYDYQQGRYDKSKAKNKDQSKPPMLTNDDGSKGFARHVPSTVRFTELTGVGQGALSGVNSGAIYDNPRKGWSRPTRVQASTFEEPNTALTGSKFNWAHSFGMEQFGLGAGDSKGGSFRQFVTDGDAGNNFVEKSGNDGVAFGNAFSAIFGLYYYDGCMDEDNNWHVLQVVGGKQFQVRMRMYNPNYEWDGIKYLRMKKVELQEYGIGEVGEDGEKSKFVCGKQGIMVPRCKLEVRPDHHKYTGKDKLPPSPAMLLSTSDREAGDGKPGVHKTRISPVIANSDETRVPFAKKELIDSHKYFARRLSNLHNPGDFMWGFNVPAAFYLYPYFEEEARIVEKEEAKKGVRVYFQPWPTWKRGITKAPTVNPDPLVPTLQLATESLFDFGDAFSPDLTKRRLHALDKDTATAAAAAAPYFAVSVTQTTTAVPTGATMSTTEAEEDVPAGEDELPAPATGNNDSGVAGDVGGPEIEATQGGPLGGAQDTPREELFESEVTENINTNTEMDIDVNIKKLTGVKGSKLQACAPGAERRMLNDAASASSFNEDLNAHFFSTRQHPWPHKDIYKPSTVKYQTTDMTPDKIKEYKEKYGSLHNLYLRGELRPKNITGIEQNYGEFKKTEDGKSILSMRLDHNDPVFRANLCRILSIYHDNSKLGYTHNEITFEQKQLGMRGGIYILKDLAPQSLLHGQLKFGKPKKNEWSQYICVCRPVFDSPPPKPKKGFDFKTARGENDQVANLEFCQPAKLNSIRSSMSVLEWVCSPWHYAYLPYRPQSMLFKDGETYSEGCIRCSRPFFEFENMYMSYKKTEKDTVSWPFKFWQVDGNGIAPTPFHDKRFWDPKTTSAVKVASKDKVGLVNKDEDHPDWYSDIVMQGWHQWEVHEFKFMYEGVLKPEFVKSKDAIVGDNGKFNNFFRGPKHKPPYARYGNKSFTFKKYKNHIHDNERESQFAELVTEIINKHVPRNFGIETWLTDAGRGYIQIPQGRLSYNKKVGKFQMGQRKLMLQRGSKYGNLCRDCCTVLDLSPGLLHRNHRVASTIGLLKSNPKAVNRGTDWWTRLINTQHMGHLRTINFDTDTIFTNLSRVKKEKRDEYQTSFEDSMEIYKAALENHHQTAQALGNTTKYKDAPEVYIQKTNFFPVEGVSAKKDADLINEAVRSIQTAIRTESPADLDLTNVALRDLLDEIVRKYQHEDMFIRDDSRVFDSEMMRLEIRNCQWIYNEANATGKWKLPEQHKNLTNSIKVKGPDSSWKNCLIVRMWKPKKGTKGLAKTNSSTGEVTYVYDLSSDDYEDKAYFATIQDDDTCASPPDMPTMWCGDKFVAPKAAGYETEFVSANNNQPAQWRKMRQSRFFITYSLHRALRDELNARKILETMADAARELFGNDVNLAELLTFGYGMEARSDTGKKDAIVDSLGAGEMKIIEKTKKKDAMPNFFGRPGRGTSYIYDTYETHVERVTCDGGIEIGPSRHHAHFHILLTVNHWSYIQFDYFKMNSYLELMFKGKDPFHRGWVNEDRPNGFLLQDASGSEYYTDAEYPYVDIRLYPQDNWQDVIAAYVRKNATPGVFEAIRARVGPPPNSNTGAGQ